MKINRGGSRQQFGIFSEDVEVDVASLTRVGVNVAQYSRRTSSQSVFHHAV